MALLFQNRYNKTLWIALLYGDTARGSKFRKQGWWNVDPGQTRNIWNVDLRRVNRFACFYAEEFKGGGGATWSGLPSDGSSMSGVSPCRETGTGSAGVCLGQAVCLAGHGKRPQ
jgi:Protein of unknown function (DUF1036)